MDIAQELEQLVLERHKPVNAVTKNGNSAIQQFYEGSTVFVTGGSGFLGKQLIEKLFRSCAIKKIYVLMRSKKGAPVQERLEFMLKDPVYDSLQQKDPLFADKIAALEGDVAEVRLGLSDKNWTVLTEEVNMIFHLAATIRFDEPIRSATLINVRGTREAIDLAKKCRNLKCLVHVSTGFTHATAARVGTTLMEQFYPCPVPPEVLIQLAESVAEERLDDMTPQMIKGWPNTYTFTKAVAEELVRTSAGDLPVCVVKPPVVLPAYYEPTPGWADISVLFSPCGILVGAGLGVLHVLFTNTKVKLNMVPVDYVNNAIIAAGWDSVEGRSHHQDLPVYAVSSTKCGVDWGFLGNAFRSDYYQKFSCPKAVWHCYLIETNNMFLYWLLTCVLHYIPAYILDFIFYVFRIKIKGIPSVTNLYKKIYKMSTIFGYFLTNEWQFNDNNLSDMITRMSDSDKMIYNCDVSTIDYPEYILVLSIGLRKFIVKDGLIGSEKAYKRQKWLKYVNIVFLMLYAYVMYMIVTTCFRMVKYVIY